MGKLAPILVISLATLRLLPAEVPPSLREALEERFRPTDLVLVGNTWMIHNPGSILVVQKEGLGWNRDEFRARQLSPRTAEIDIRKGRIRAERRVENLLRAGELLVPYNLKLRPDRIELSCRTLAYYPVWRGRVRGDRRNLFREELVSTKLRFFFDNETIRDGRLEPLLSAIETWVKPFSNFSQALQNSAEVDPDGYRNVFVGMSREDLEIIFGQPSGIVQVDTFVGRQRDWQTYLYANFEVSFQDGRVVSFHEFKRQHN